MKRINEDLLRIRLGISQESFAHYLGITRSLLAMYEKGLRSLPTAALIKMSNLEIARLKMEESTTTQKVSRKPIQPRIQKHDAKIQKMMARHAEHCLFKAKVLQHKLDSMVAENTKAETWSILLEHVLTAEIKEKKQSHDLLWLDIQRDEIEKKITKNGLAAQVKLQAQLQALEAEANAYKTLAEKL